MRPSLVSLVFFSLLLVVPHCLVCIEAWTPSTCQEHRINMSGKFLFCIDRGGTFTDVHCILPDGTQVVRKLLSEDPAHYNDAPTEGIRRLLNEFSSNAKYPRGLPVATDEIGSIRMGTTVATNALLERDGARMALLITKGFRDLLEIGNQARPNIFDLTCAKPSLLYEKVVEVDERVVLDEFYPTNTTDVELEKRIGITGEAVLIVQKPDMQKVEKDLQQLLDDGITALAIATMHSYTYPEHELQIGKLAEKMGFTQISLSSQVMPMVKIVSRYVLIVVERECVLLVGLGHVSPSVRRVATVFVRACVSMSSTLTCSRTFKYTFQWTHGMCRSLSDSQDYYLFG